MSVLSGELSLRCRRIITWHIGISKALSHQLEVSLVVATVLLGLSDKSTSAVEWTECRVQCALKSIYRLLLRVPLYSNMPQSHRPIEAADHNLNASASGAQPSVTGPTLTRQIPKCTTCSIKYARWI